jgi:hypothetical protein
VSWQVAAKDLRAERQIDRDTHSTERLTHKNLQRKKVSKWAPPPMTIYENQIIKL